MTKRAIPFAVAAALAAAGAGAQPPDTKNADTTRRSGHDTFMTDAAADGLAEVELGQMAADKATRQDIKDFGKMKDIAGAKAKPGGDHKH
jgi:predicted outer membrane protein